MQNLPDISNQLSSSDLFDAFKKQLKKDFEQSNLSADFVETIEQDYESIHSTILFELQRSEKRTDFNLMNLLYRIDISEKQLQQYLNNAGNDGYYNVIAELIIKRVLQKVVIKQFYKGSANQ